MVLLVFRVLLELQSNDDPVWMYFDNHHKYILDQMNTSYRSSVAALEGAPKLGIISISTYPKIVTIRRTSEMSDSTTVSDDLALSELQTAFANLEAKQAEVIIGLQSRLDRPKNCFIDDHFHFLQQNLLMSQYGRQFSIW